MVAPPRELLAAAKGADDPTASFVILFEERVHTFEADGRHRSRYRYVYKILTEAALDDEGIGESWSPWHESEPKIRARVVTRDGKAYGLDPKTFETSGVRASDPDVFTDRRQVRAPLPGLAVGAVVEEEIVVDSQPVLPGLGMSARFHFGAFVPVRKARLVLEAPRGVPLHVVERPSGAVRPTRSETGDRVRLVYETGPLAAGERADEGWPDDVPVFPEVRYATGPTWREIAARYADIVDRQIAGADVGA